MHVNHGLSLNTVSMHKPQLRPSQKRMLPKKSLLMATAVNRTFIGKGNATYHEILVFFILP